MSLRARETHQNKHIYPLGTERETWQGPQNFPHPSPPYTSSCGFSRVQPVLSPESEVCRAQGAGAPKGSPAPTYEEEEGGYEWQRSSLEAGTVLNVYILLTCYHPPTHTALSKTHAGVD